jgi:hypothetical protein
VLSAIAIVSSAPVMVPELAAGAAPELADLRDAAFAAVAALPARWIAVGVGPSEEVIDPSRSGTFAGYGVDVPVALSPDPRGQDRLPLCALITGWLRGRVDPSAQAEVRVFSSELGVDAAVARGRQLRGAVDAAADPVGVVVVADGVHTLTPSAPGGYDPDSGAVQAALDDALASGDVDALQWLPDTVVGRVAYQVLAGIGRPRSAKELYRGAPYGVGYFVGIWQP